MPYESLKISSRSLCLLEVIGHSSAQCKFWGCIKLWILKLLSLYFLSWTTNPCYMISYYPSTTLRLIRYVPYYSWLGEITSISKVFVIQKYFKNISVNEKSALVKVRSIVQNIKNRPLQRISIINFKCSEFWLVFIVFSKFNTCF